MLDSLVHCKMLLISALKKIFLLFFWYIDKKVYLCKKINY